jgi:uncharacterized protein (TIGR04255 family)
MVDLPEDAVSQQLPEFERPPVVEVALGVQFRPLVGPLSIELAELRERWRRDFPLAQEHPPLPPAIEGAASGLGQVQVLIAPVMQHRFWFLSADFSDLIQVQADRLNVNWRKTRAELNYPRYGHVRGQLAARLGEFADYAERHRLGSLEITQAEANYVNAIILPQGELGRLEHALRLWQPTPLPNVGIAAEAHVSMVFPISQGVRGPSRLYVAVDPSRTPDGDDSLLLTLTVRGAPAGDDIAAAMEFIDRAHEHVVRSFAELTPLSMHATWGRTR